MEKESINNLLNNLFLTHKIDYLETEKTVTVYDIDLNEELISLFEFLNEKTVVTEFEQNKTIQDNFKKLSLNTQVNIYIDATFLRTNIEYSFYNTVNEFLRLNRTKLENKIFYINEIKLTYKDIEKDIFFKYYDAICLLQSIVKNIAEGEAEKIINSDLKYTIFDKRKLIITSKYEYSDLLEMQKKENFFSLIAELQDETMKDNDRRTNILFLINAFENVFKIQKEEVLFSEILSNLQDIYEEYQVHHRAYINSLEPGKLKEAFEKEIQDALGKLNSLLSDVNSKIIFLPIAFIVSLGQLSSDHQAKNLIIFMGMFIFCLLVHKFLKTQQELLNVIKYDIDDRRILFEQSVSKFSRELEPKMARLLNLVDSIDKRFNWTIYLTWSILVVVFTAVIYYCCQNEIINYSAIILEKIKEHL